jgi:dihydropteroate synthase
VISLAPRLSYAIPLPSGRVLLLGERCLVMGVVNVTPDSFAERAPSSDAQAAVDAALAMEADGADLIDIGGESTRPGAAAVGAEEEMARVIPVIRALAGRLNVPVSVDTTKADVARAALAEGADIVNDISGLQYDPALGPVVAEAHAALIVMHMRGQAGTMYERAHYANLVAEVSEELGRSVRAATAAGVPRARLIVDPGVGFAKRPADSYGVLARIHEFAQALERPVLAGPSRKSFMRDALRGRPAIERDWGTAAAVTAAVLGGAHIVRVHATAEMVQVVRVADEIRNAWTS